MIDGFPIPYGGSHYAKRMVRLFGRRLSPGGPPRESDPPQTFVICFSPRCGSNYLGAALASTGKFPRAREYFNDRPLTKLGGELRNASFHQVCMSIVQQHVRNGCFATKLVWEQLYFLTETGVIPDVLGTPRLILISRRDLLAQAISFVIADQSQAWSSKSTRAHEPTYDRDAISAAIARFAQSTSYFRSYASIFGLAALEVVYEDLINEPESTISRTLDWCGCGGGKAKLERIPFQKQADSVNAQWRDRYLNEMRGYFDEGISHRPTPGFWQRLNFRFRRPLGTEADAVE